MSNRSSSNEPVPKTTTESCRTMTGLTQKSVPALASAIEATPAELQDEIFSHVRVTSHSTINTQTLPVARTLDLVGPLEKTLENAIRLFQVYSPTSVLSDFSPSLEGSYRTFYLKTTSFYFDTIAFSLFPSLCCSRTPSRVSGWWGDDILPFQSFLLRLTEEELQGICTMELRFHYSILLLLFAPYEVVLLLGLPIARLPHWQLMRDRLRCLKLNSLTIGIINGSCCPESLLQKSNQPWKQCPNLQRHGWEADPRWISKAVLGTGIATCVDLDYPVNSCGAGLTQSKDHRLYSLIS